MRVCVKAYYQYRNNTKGRTERQKRRQSRSKSVDGEVVTVTKVSDTKISLCKQGK